MCCCAMKIPGVLAVVPAAVLLTISFFVLVVNKKQEQGIRVFGYVVAAVLWLAALCAFSCGVYMMAKGGPKCMMMDKMTSMMKGDMGGKGCMGKGEMPMPMNGPGAMK
ncbi:MAG: hypothetical protein NT079_05900 [Candidatus Omnitrophica bacterium]|nr:hypothetical protein [Candidatus Omnitrophota bacterium]